MRAILTILGHVLQLTLIALLIGLILLLSGCGNNAGSGPIIRDHGWTDGLYAVEIGGHEGLIEVIGGEYYIGGERIEARWTETKTRGATAVGGWWYQGTWRGYLVGIRAGYQFRLVHIRTTASPVKVAG